MRPWTVMPRNRCNFRRGSGQVNSTRKLLRIGSRGSALAMRQAEHFVSLIKKQYPDLECGIQAISTAGDRDKQTSLTVIGGQGIFAKELQSALLSGKIDVAVHSVKDLTSVLPEGLMLCSIFDRVDPRDVIISEKGTLDTLPEGSTIGTSSRRRLAQIKRLRPDLDIRDLRGNIDTRIGKVRSGQLDAAVLAAAGVRRMDWGAQIAQYLEPARFVPAPGQGALGLEIRSNNDEIRELLTPIQEPDVALAVEAERAFLRGVGGGCTSPIGAYAEIDGDTATFTGMLATEDLTKMCVETRTVPRTSVLGTAAELAAEMLRELNIAPVGARR
jgi:hydroxymethylbilane synthase